MKQVQKERPAGRLHMPFQAFMDWLFSLAAVDCAHIRLSEPYAYRLSFNITPSDGNRLNQV